MANAKRDPYPPLDWCEDCDPPCRARLRGEYSSEDEKALALRVGGNLWYPEGSSYSKRELAGETAKLICRTECPIFADCWAYILQHNERYGVWAGLSEEDRGYESRGIRRRNQQLQLLSEGALP